MGLWRMLTRWRDAPTPDRNDTAVTFSREIPTPVDDMIHLSGADPATIPVRREQALTIPGVLRGRNLMCSIATLPLIARGSDRIPVRSPLLEQINPNVPNVVTLAQTIEDLLFEGIAWWRITRRGADGFPRAAEHLDVGRVSINPPPGTPPHRLPSGEYPGGIVWVDDRPVPGRELIRFDSPNPGILKAASRSIRRAITFERTAATYAEDPRPLDYFTPAEGADPVKDDEVRDILDEWRQARRDRASAYVPASLTYNTVEAFSPADLQLVELQKQVVIDIANILGLDAEDLQVSTTSRTYNNATDRRRDRINDVLSPFMRAITDRLSMNDVTRRGHVVTFQLDDYMRADPMTRWSTYQTGLQNEIVSVPEVREMEGLPAVPVEPAPRPRRPRDHRDNEGQEQKQETSMSMSAKRVQFSGDGATRISFDMPTSDVEFRVDRDKRSISGMLVPWDTIARSGFAKYRFSRDSLTWSQESRVKLNREHDRSQAVGVATRLQSTSRGLDGSFRIARGDEGDKVLSLAEDGVLDGFSIEAEFNSDGSSYAADPEDDLVRLVSDARLVGVAITASPAFDDARVSGVNATRGEQTMPDTTKGTTNEAAFTAAVEQFTGAITALSETQQQQAQAHRDLVDQIANMSGPDVVDPTTRTAQTSVNEEPMYRFDGIGGQHDFSSDMIAGAKGDGESLARVEQWVAENFSLDNQAAAFVDQADVSSLNPQRQRPDMYVDQLDHSTPIWDSIRKGSIADNTPFVLPKFDSASGLVSDHTEGQEPETGSFKTTSQTITPSAVSGRVEITRETFDQGGNPQLSTILWRQIVRAYNEALEEAAATLLGGLTVPKIDLSQGVTDADLQGEVTAAMAGLQFVRGGHRFRDFKLNESLYSALATAVDGDGRALFPMIAPSNTTGSADQYWGSLNIGGLVGRPAWALPSTADSATSSYLYNREDVHGWASNPNRLEFSYRVAYVDVAVWGYKALACTREDGVREITYNPSSGGEG